MSLPTTRPQRLARTAFVALLMSGVATGALAAPSAHKHHHAKTAAAPARDAKLEALQAQVDEMRAEMAQMRQAQNASQDDGRVSALQAQLADVTQQLKDVKADQTTASADIITLKSPAVVPSLGNGKMALATSDGRFTANIRATVMLDTAKYFQKSGLPAAVTNRDLNDGTNFRRARFGIDGKLFKDFDYALIYEFGGSGAEDAGHIQEAWAQYTGFKPWRIRVGAFEPNIGLAAAVSTSQMPLLERPAPAEVARNVAAGDSRSAIQIAGNGLWGDGDSGIATRWFASGAITGNTVSTVNSTGAFAVQPLDEQTGIIGRFAIAPFQSTDWQLHLGVNGQYVTQPNDSGVANNANRYPIQLRDRPELRVDGTRLVDTGGIDAKSASVLGLEAGATVQNFLIETEYFKYNINRRITGALPFSDPDFSGWYMQGVWVLTGESRPYNPGEARFDAPKPNYNFNPAAGTWGAFEIAARFSDLDLNYHDCGAGVAIPAVATAKCFDAIRGGEQKVTSLGLNWYMNPDIRFMLDYLHVDVNRFNAAGVQVGQKYNAVGLRGQFVF
jgi:phosphate-selective porin OprO/OprP